MNVTLIYRVLIAIRGCWIVVEWFFGWGPHSRVDSLTLLHPYASLVAHAIAVMFLLFILTGLWFFQRWARLIFVLLLAVPRLIPMSCVKKPVFSIEDQLLFDGIE